MKVEAIALTDFIHGDINAIEGRVCRHSSGDLLDSGIAGDLERAGLVRIRMTPSKSVPVADVKPADDGPGQPSSYSPAAPPFQTTTSDTLRRGPGRPRKDVSLP